ncbi:MAG: hypothetical protein IAE99_08010 [Rhodothermales bacterium]|nr:hypothetical protein [Rhodothermales bacterium]
MVERVTYHLPSGRAVPARVVRRAGDYALIHYIDRYAPFSPYLRRRLVRSFVHASRLS